CAREHCSLTYCPEVLDYW
nr:immunoglobulin heavy chain junction region [Macaca mulatta]MOX00448.1 immunoglobulin heavy chain junction region [Macaca mulatta]MOX06703.1 immunoglobulin heavy chain junction region [Macaca mulatta]MOX06803.1 immunoglobulin heavy chain junction region [Macaca mulatta]